MLPTTLRARALFVFLASVACQVTTTYGTTGATTLKGDVIYFPHDGPQVAVKELRERRNWLEGSDMKVVLVGPDGEHDNLANWLLARNVLRVRPRVVFNHLTVRDKLDRAMRDPEAPNPNASYPNAVTPMLSYEDVCEILDGLQYKDRSPLVDSARVIANGVACGVEAVQQAVSDDVARVRDPDAASTMSRVALLPSGSSCEDATAARLRAVQEMRLAMEGGSRGGGDGGGEDDDGGDADDGGGDGDAGWSGADPPPARVPRSRNPHSEFEHNGLHLMELFRTVFPLMRYELEPVASNTGAEVERRGRWYPLTAHGSLTDKQTRHLLLQFTNVAACNSALIFVLANQKRRHAVLRAVAARVKHSAFEPFAEGAREPVLSHARRPEPEPVRAHSAHRHTRALALRLSSPLRSLPGMFFSVIAQSSTRTASTRGCATLCLIRRVGRPKRSPMRCCRCSRWSARRSRGAVWNAAASSGKYSG